MIPRESISNIKRSFPPFVRLPTNHINRIPRTIQNFERLSLIHPPLRISWDTHRFEPTRRLFSPLDVSNRSCSFINKIVLIEFTREKDSEFYQILSTLLVKHLANKIVSIHVRFYELLKKDSTDFHFSTLFSERSLTSFWQCDRTESFETNDSKNKVFSSSRFSAFLTMQDARDVSFQVFIKNNHILWKKIQ